MKNGRWTRRSILTRGVWACFAAPAAVQSLLAQVQTVVALQPFAQHVRRVEDALDYLGQPLPLDIQNRINQAIGTANEEQAVAAVQDLLDPFVLAIVNINGESRVKVAQGTAKPELVEGGTRLFLVKVENEAPVRSRLVVQSPNSGPTYIQSSGVAEPKLLLTSQVVAERWADISTYAGSPMSPTLSGLAVEYVILGVYSRDRGQRSAQVAFNVGQGTQDIGFRNDILIVFDCKPARSVSLHVRDEKGEPSFASFIIRDQHQRIYPNPSKRLAPDFPFQQQIYRTEGESIRLPEGKYTVEYSRGPEYLSMTKELNVHGNGPDEMSFRLQRWIDPSTYGWWSGDHHIHAAGCSHYENPTEGVDPEVIMRQVLGEGLNTGAVLTWGPSWYHQKGFFTSQDSALSTAQTLLHYDVEVSLFPSSHAGHLVLLGLTEDDYPGTTRIEEWPSWDYPVMRWAKLQGAVVGFAHSGVGLQVKTNQLPNYEMPAFDSVGANEYIVDVTQPDTVDFISVVDTPYVWELNIWYHTLNAGFRARIAGETDFPCISADTVGTGRSYVKLDRLTYRGWIDGIRSGRSYVGDGKSHLIDFSVNGVEVGSGSSEVAIDEGRTARIQVKAAAMLKEFPELRFHNNALMVDLPYDQRPYWDVERARIPGTRDVPVEVIVNGLPVARKIITADGKVREMDFEVPIRKSSWVAVRILASSHTNPVFAIVEGKPVRASRASVQWCMDAVSQCWTQKSPLIRPSERDEALKFYNKAREVYRQRLSESPE